MTEDYKEDFLPESSEGGLLDWLVTVAENLKLLVVGPLAAGLVALGIGFAMPQSYTSESILALPSTSVDGVLAATTTPTLQAAAMMTSPLVLDPVIETVGLRGELTVQQARKQLISQIKTSVGKDGLLRLEATAYSPTVAQNIANAVIDSWLKSTVPSEIDRADLEKRLESAKSSLMAVEQLLKKLTTDGAANLSQPLTRGEAGTSIVGISELQSKFLNEVLRIPHLIQGLPRSVVKQAPTLPTETVAPKKGAIAMLVTLGTGVILMIWIFARQWWRKLSLDRETADKQARLLAAIRVRS